MTPDNVKTIVKIYDRYRQRDFAFVEDYFDPGADVYQTEMLPWGGHYRGHAGVRAFFSKLGGKIEANVRVEHFIDAGDRVVEIGRTSAMIQRTGQAVAVPQVHVWRFKNRKVAGFEAYVDTPTVMAALA